MLDSHISINFLFKAGFILSGYQKAGDRDQDLTSPMWHYYFGKNVVLTP